MLQSTDWMALLMALLAALQAVTLEYLRRVNARPVVVPPETITNAVTTAVRHLRETDLEIPVTQKAPDESEVIL